MSKNKLASENDGERGDKGGKREGKASGCGGEQKKTGERVGYSGMPGKALTVNEGRLCLCTGWDGASSCCTGMGGDFYSHIKTNKR